MAHPKDGDIVHVHYTGMLDDGTVFDTSRDGEPLGFTLGSGQVIPGFEGAIRGLEPGQSTKVSIPPDEAYGAYRDDLLIEVGREQMPPEIEPQVGHQLQLTLDGGQQIPVAVTEITDDVVTLDANHPLAGKTLNFTIELVKVES